MTVWGKAEGTRLTATPRPVGECSLVSYNGHQSRARHGGSNVSDDLQKLLNYIVHQFTGQAEVKELERDASSVEPQSEIRADQLRVLQDEEARAVRLTPAFREGLARAIAAHRAGGNAISLDDRNPIENTIADAMVHFLVSPGIATSTARETEPCHYIYTIAIDWSRLNAVAAKARVDLDAAARDIP